MLELDVVDLSGKPKENPICLGCVAGKFINKRLPVIGATFKSKNFLLIINQLIGFRYRLRIFEIFYALFKFIPYLPPFSFFSGVNLFKYFIATSENTLEVMDKMYAICAGTGFRSPEACRNVTKLMGVSGFIVRKKRKIAPMAKRTFFFCFSERSRGNFEKHSQQSSGSVQFCL